MCNIFKNAFLTYVIQTEANHLFLLKVLEAGRYNKSQESTSVLFILVVQKRMKHEIRIV